MKQNALNLQIGSNLDKTSEADMLWELVPGKMDESNAYYVSIESYNKPGLYITATENGVGLSQDDDGKKANAQTFITVSGLSGEGVSFESLEYVGMYLTLVNGVATLTDGSDAEASSFIIE